MYENDIEKIARLAFIKGVNLKKGQQVVISCPAEKFTEGRIFAKTAYDLGAGLVTVDYYDDVVKKYDLNFAEESLLTSIPKWFVDKKNSTVKTGACYVAIDCDDPDVFSGCNEERLFKRSLAVSKSLKKYSADIMSNKISWCVVAVPSKAWAEKIFGKVNNAEEKLLSEILKACKITDDNYIDNFDKHVVALKKRAEILNNYNFRYLHYKSNSGTDFKVGLAKNHVWLSAEEKNANGRPFIANIPTEEIFTSPDKNFAEGVLKNELPLSYNGNIIDGFSFTFKKGKIVGFSAEKGYDTLKNLINTDNGTKRLGEVALIGKNSPIKKSGVLFYNTLFDENASCHFALGKAYPTTVKGGDKKTLTELKSYGLNDSVEHVDFMVGSDGLSITGVTYDGKKIPVFIDGDFAF